MYDLTLGSEILNAKIQAAKKKYSRESVGFYLNFRMKIFVRCIYSVIKKNTETQVYDRDSAVGIAIAYGWTTEGSEFESQ
jgi:outer membrane protease